MKILNKLRNAFPLLLVAVLSFILDQLTKWLVIQKLDVYAQVEVIEGFFNLFHIRNPGAAFGILQGQQTFLIIFTVLALGIIGYYYFYYSHSLWMRIGLGFLLGGALGNLLDRLRMGEVIDFLQFGLLPDYAWPTFNVADVSVCIGMGMIFIYFYWERNTALEESVSNEEKHVE